MTTAVLEAAPPGPSLTEWCGCNCKVEDRKFNINAVPLDCAATWKLIGSGHTVGVFQLEKRLGQEWARKVRPENINELADLLSLLRPGCLESNMTADYAVIKAGKRHAEYLHPVLKPILEPTYGCLVYQEQAIRIAVEVAGFSLAQADNLRKGIGKKLPEVIAKLKKEFVDGAAKKGTVSRPVAEEIFGWIEAFQRYGFNKSHAVSYAMVAYQTAYLKCHYPAEFYTSYLTYSHYKGDQMEEIYRLVQDARLFGVDVLPPDIRKGNAHFMMTDEGIVFGLSHIRGVGQSALEKILEMQVSGPDALSPGGEAMHCADTVKDHIAEPTGKSLSAWPDFLVAVPELHRNVGEALIRSGACDGYGLTRLRMLAELQAVLGTSTRDEKGDKAEVRGLTEREREWFFTHVAESGSVLVSLQAMMADTAADARPISKLTKPEIIAAIGHLDQSRDAAEMAKLTRKALEGILRDGLGYSPRRPAINGGSRRAAIEKKIAELQQEREDTARVRAEAEKHYLGIALSCSPADDADPEQATATCIDVARAPNGQNLRICAIIDLVRHTKTKRGKNPGSPMCFLTLSDSTYSIDHAVVFPGAYDQLKAVCKEDLIVLATGQKRDGSFIIEDIRVLI